MQAITQRFVMPIYPKTNEIKTIYPWDTNYINIFIQQIYARAVETGDQGSLEEFKTNLGTFMQNTIDISYYSGQYEATPLPFLEQILKTQGTVLTQNVVIHEIPYFETSNLAGGYTVTIG